MSRTTVLCLASVALLASIQAAPLPRDRLDDRPIFPTLLGTRWSYHVTSHFMGKRESVCQWEIRSVEHRGDATIIDVWGSNAAAVNQRITVSKGGVAVQWVSHATNEQGHPTWWLRTPVRAGFAWKHSLDSPGLMNEGGTCTVGPAERVEVPAGSFVAVPVVWDYTWGPQPRKERMWFAPGVGFVKRLGPSSLMELTAFEPGRD